MTVLIVDGGGSKTRAWLVNSETRECLKIIEVGPSNIATVGAEGLIAVLRDLAKKLSAGPKADALVLGMAGVGRRPERQTAFHAARGVFPAADLHIITDAELAYRGAFSDGRHGILLIAGTGAIALYRTPIGHEFSRAGGWGPLLGDEGGGMWMGREVLRHCLLEWERDELGSLHAAVLEELELETASQILTKVYQENFGPTEWAKLAPLVFRFAREDIGALRILKNAAIELVGLVEHLQETLAPEAQALPLVVLGGLWEHHYHLQPLMEEEIRIRNLPIVFTEPVGGCMEGGLVFLQERGKIK
jgi:glucosamine kinase